VKAAVVETPFRAATDVEGARNRAYLDALLEYCYAWGLSPYASHDVIPRIIGMRDNADTDIVARVRGLAAGDVWAERADVIVFGVDLGWSEGMLRRLRHTWQRDARAPLREVLFARRSGRRFELQQPLYPEIKELMGW
jgi:hypothetical protein